MANHPLLFKVDIQFSSRHTIPLNKFYLETSMLTRNWVAYKLVDLSILHRLISQLVLPQVTASQKQNRSLKELKDMIHRL